MHDSPWGAPEEDLAATAGESRQDTAFLWAPGPGDPLVMQESCCPLPDGHPIPAAPSRVVPAMARPHFQQPTIGDMLGNSLTETLP